MRFIIFYLSSFLFLFSACSKLEDHNTDVNTDFELLVQRPYDPNAKTIILNFTSTKLSACPFEDSIQYSIKTDRDFSKIDFLGFYRNMACSDLPGKLTQQFTLPFNGEHGLEINLQGAVKNELNFIEDPDGISILWQSPKGISLKHNYIHNIPKNLIWGYAYSLATADTLHNGCNEFLNSFIKQITASFGHQNLVPGFYSYFTIKPDHDIDLSVKPNFINRQSAFYYFHNMTDEELSNYFLNLTNKYNKLVGYEIFLGNGKIIQSSNFTPVFLSR